MPGVRHFAACNLWMTAIAVIVGLAALASVGLWKRVRRKLPHKIVALSLLTIAEGYVVAMSTLIVPYELVIPLPSTTPIICFTNARKSQIVPAVTFAIIAVASLIIFAIQTRCDFTMCRSLLIVFVTLCITISLLCAFTEFGRTYVFISILSGLAVVIFVVYLIRKLQLLGIMIYFDAQEESSAQIFAPDDIQMIMAGKRWSEITSEEYVLAVILLYLDTMLIFFYLSQILSDCDCDE